MTDLFSTQNTADLLYIGSYRVTKQLGEGAFGLVYQAYQPFLDRQVAIKTLHANLTNNPSIEQQFMHEARTIARLRHPNIVAVFEFGAVPSKDKPETYMVMEYLPGATLQTLLKEGPLPVTQVVEITEQLASALDYAHAHNIVHRDLKPANIMFSEQGQPVIADFGLAKLMEITGGQDKTGASLFATSTSGTPAYMSPEQAGGRPAGPASDQYSLALMVFEMLTGQLPFSGKTLSAMVAARFDELPRSLSTVAGQFPPAADAVLQRALMLDPEARYPSATAFASALTEALLPGRQGKHVITLVDPVQAAQLRSARQTVLGFMWGLVLVTLVVTLFCAIVFLRGYLNAEASFMWDGIIASSSIHDGVRDVIGLWPGSPAERAGMQVGDTVRADILYDLNVKDGDYTVDGQPRSVYPINWQPQDGDLIGRTVNRNGQPVQISYPIERSPYFLILFVVQLPGVILGFVCAERILRRWGAEPGVQVFTMLVMMGSFTLVASGASNVLVNIDNFALYLFMPLLLHFILVFPEPSDYLQKHGNRIWLLYLPLPFALFQFLLGQELFDRINVVVYAIYAVLILVALLLKWARRDLKRYRPLWILISALVLASLTGLLGETIQAFDDLWTVNALWGGNALRLLVADYSIITIGSTLSILLATIGLHRVQLLLGRSVPEDTPSSDPSKKSQVSASSLRA